jgi:hypothetical protein
MGFMDKLKKFAGGKNMASVEVTAIEGMLPAEVTVGIGDRTISGSMRVTAQQDCEIIATKYEIILRTLDDDDEWSDVIVAYTKDVESREMSAGDEFDLDWAVDEVDIAQYLRHQEWDNVNDAVGDASVKIVVNCIADVKGSPFDPNAEAEVGGLTLQNPLALTIPVIEGQASEHAYFPVTDSVLKGTVVVTANEVGTLTATKYEVRLEIDTDDGTIDVFAGKDQTPELDPNPLSVSFGGTDIKFPKSMKPGAEATQTWMVMDLDFPKVLAEHGIDDPSAAVDEGRVRLMVSCSADFDGASGIGESRVQVQLTS